MRLRRRGKPARHAHARTGELTDHFAQRRILAADADVGDRSAHFARLNPMLKKSRSISRRLQVIWVLFVRTDETGLFYRKESTLLPFTAMATQKRAAFFISDRTGITAEMLGHSLLTQFESVRFQEVTLPFVDTVEKAHEIVQRINEAGAAEGVRPIVISTLVNTEIATIVGAGERALSRLFRDFHLAARKRARRAGLARDRPQPQPERPGELLPPHRRGELRAGARRRRCNARPLATPTSY